MNLLYAGIGSREISDSERETIAQFSKILSDLGYTLRSGGANGADTAFEENHSGPKEIYLPWKKFNGNESPLYKITEEAKVMARKYHPMGNALVHPAWYLMARNCYQVLGLDLCTPVDFVVCCTPSEYKGGTSQALRICRDLGIKYFNIKNENEIFNLANYLKI